jgi:diguanylate cyclase (GGDEF)-like protein
MGSFRVKLVIYFALLALLPSAIAFYGFHRLAQRTETSRVDARLQAGLRATLSGYAARLDDAQRRATLVAREPGLQEVLRNGTDDDIRAFVNTRTLLLVVRGSRTFGTEPRLVARRSVDIVDRGIVVGQVVAVVPVDAKLLRAVKSGLDPDDVLVAVRDGEIVAGRHRGESLAATTPGRAARVSLGGKTYRGLSTEPLDDPSGVELAAFTPQSVIDAATAGTERRLFVGLFASLLLFALVTYFVGRSIVRTLGQLAGAADEIARGNFHQRVEVRGRDEFAQLGAAFNRMAAQLEQRLVELEEERHRLRESTARFGEALEATHDVEQLLRVIVETAVEVTGAYGGLVLDNGREIARTGDPDAGLQKIAFPLRTGAEDFGSLVLAAPQFDSDQVEKGAALASNAVIALENARLHDVVERQALVDPLTELSNRRALEETLRAELARAGRFGDAVCLVLADLDDFKSVNDRYGHPCGDDVLREFAQTLEETVREIDVAGRWGGEEFALILPGTDAAGGAALAERARARLESRIIRAPNGDRIPVTASFGVAAFPDGGDMPTLVAASDAALYRAKRAGKNRVVTAAEVSRR